MTRRLAPISALVAVALFAGALLGAAPAAHAQTGVAPTCAALQSFVNHGTILDDDERIAAGRADLKQAIAAAKASDDAKLVKMTVKFRVALEAAVVNAAAARAKPIVTPVPQRGSYAVADIPLTEPQSRRHVDTLLMQTRDCIPLFACTFRRNIRLLGTEIQHKA